MPATEPELPDGAHERSDQARKLAAILSADVAGYSRLMGADEAATLRRLKALRRIVDARIEANGGRIVSTAGDGILADFKSVIGAVRAAVEIQREIVPRNRELPAEQRLEFRIGINLGDVIVDGEDIFGDGVNIAARLQAIGEPGGIIVSGGVYEQVHHKLDLAFQDRGGQKVKNIADPIRVYAIEPAHVARTLASKRRVRFALLAAGLVGLLMVGGGAWLATSRLLVPPSTSFDAADEPIGALAETQRPRVAVLPFSDQSSDASGTYFSDGVSEDIITELSRFADLIVVPWSAVEAFKHEQADPAMLRQALDVRYLVDGSIRRASEQVRVTVHLSGAQGAGVLWSERYEEPLDETFALQDRVVRQIVAELAIRLTLAEQQRAAEQPDDSLDAYDLLMRGRQTFSRTTRAANFEARALFERASRLDPGYAAPHVWLARTYIQVAEQGWTEQPPKALDMAVSLLRKAVRLDPEYASAHAFLASAHLWQRRRGIAIAEAKRAIELNPNDLDSRHRASVVLLMAGETDAALEGLERIAELSPNPPESALANLALAYVLRDHAGEAVQVIERLLMQDPEAESPLRWIASAAAYQFAGQEALAAEAADRVLRFDPFFSPEQFAATFWRSEDAQEIEQLLIAAGLG